MRISDWSSDVCSSDLGAAVALLTFERATVGAMSCNPAIGGLGMGHLVREVDALDGLIARAADAAAIHYRMLNSSKGAAVSTEEHTSELQSLMRTSYDVFSLKKKAIISITQCTT